MQMHQIRSADAGDEKTVLDVITLAFATDPLIRWMLPEDASYFEVMTGFARTFGGNGFAHGSVHIADGGLGAAMWLPPGIEPDSAAMIGVMLSAVSVEMLPAGAELMERTSIYHPDEPHWYLPLMGVDPAHQGRGIGSALLRHALERCDAEGMPAYLETSNARSIPFYQRLGFEILTSIQVGSSPTVIPMLRKAR